MRTNKKVAFSCHFFSFLILILVEEEVFLGRIVGPEVFYVFVCLAFVLYFLQVLHYLHGGAGAQGVVYELILCCRPSIQYSRLFLSSRKSIKPMKRIPFSLRHGLMLPLTTTIFLKESFILTRDCNSCSSFSLFRIANADCI